MNFVFIYFVALFFLLANAMAWDINGSKACVTGGHQYNPLLITDNNNGCYIFWEDQATWDTYGQHFDSTGRYYWFENGNKVVYSHGLPAYLVSERNSIISSGDGDYIISWISDETTISVMKKNRMGNTLWNSSFPTGSGVLSLKLSEDGKDGVFIAYAKTNYFLLTGSLFLQYIDSNGNVKYPGSGTQITNDLWDNIDYRGMYDIAYSGDSAVYVAFQNITYSTNINAQKVFASGEITNQLLCAPNGGLLKQIIGDKNGGAYLIHFAGTSLVFHKLSSIYGQTTSIINNTPNGISLSSDTSSDIYTAKAATDKNGGMGVIWERIPYSDTNNPIIYSSYVNYSTISQTNTLTLGNGNEPNILSDKTNGFFMTWVGNQSLYMNHCYVNSSIYRDPVWPSNGYIVSTTGGKNNVDLLMSDDTSKVYVAWNDGRTFNIWDANIYITGINKNLTITPTANRFRNNDSVNFDTIGDFFNFSFDQVDSSTPLPSISWLSTYGNKTGLLKLTFSSSNQGVKLTCIPRFYATPWAWRKMNLTMYSEISNAVIQESFLMYTDDTTSYFENNPSLYSIKELSSQYRGYNVRNSWTDYYSYIYPYKNNGHLQVQIMNNGNAGNIYVDNFQFAVTSPSTVYSSSFIGGTFDSTSSLFSNWGFSSLSNYTTPVYGIYTVSSLFGTFVSTINPTEGLKMTLVDSSRINVSSTKDVVFEYDTYLRDQYGTSNPDITIGYYSYIEENSGILGYKDISAYVNLGDLPTNQWRTYKIFNQSYTNNRSCRPQIQFTNNASELDYWRYIHFDNIDLQYN